MQFFASAVDTLQTLVVALGAGLGVWGVVNLLEGYGSDNPGSKSQGMKQFMAKMCIRDRVLTVRFCRNSGQRSQMKYRAALLGIWSGCFNETELFVGESSL